MTVVFKTERLYLREFELTDAEHLFNLNSDQEVLRYTGDSGFTSVKHAEEFLKNYEEYKINGFGRWAIIKRENNQFIGWCGLKINEENLVDLGFRLFRNEWNKGYATEAAKECLLYGFNDLKLNLIIGRAEIKNFASIRVLEKIGMRFWKKVQLYDNNDWVYYIKEKENL